MAKRRKSSEPKGPKETGEIAFTKFWTKLMKDMFGTSIEIIPYVAGTRGRKGTADRIIWHPFWAGWIEFKGPNTPVSGAQETMGLRMNALRPGSYFRARQAPSDDGLSGELMLQDKHGETLGTFSGDAEGVWALIQFLRDYEQIARGERKASEG